MNVIKMKIVGFDESSHSLLACFASDDTESSDPSSYPAYAFQPMNMWPDEQDVNVIAERMATAGMYQAESQARKEKFIADPQKVEQYKALVGQEFTYPVSQLLPAVSGPSNLSEVLTQTV